MQGILTEDLPNKNKKLLLTLKNLINGVLKNNLKKNEACINFVKNQKLIDYLILGFSNLKELKENILIFKKKEVNITSKFKINNSNLVDPRLW